MKLVTFEVSTPGGPYRRVGAMDESGIVDVTAAVALYYQRCRPSAIADRMAHAEAPPDLAQILEGGPEVLALATEAAVAARKTGVRRTDGGRQVWFDTADVRLLAPVPRPPGIACFTVWETHIADSSAKGFMVAFPREGSDIRGYYKGNPDSVIGPDASIPWPAYSTDLDVECEMAALVGRELKDANPEEAADAIAGYCIFNDVSARGIQKEEMALGLGPTKGKDMDGGNVLGPFLVTADELPDLGNLTMSLHVNGEEWSRYSTSQMKWSFPELLSYLSRGQTIRPGHVLTSGCYPGGSALDLGRRIAPGDVVELRITGLGALRNRIGYPA